MEERLRAAARAAAVARSKPALLPMDADRALTLPPPRLLLLLLTLAKELSHAGIGATVELPSFPAAAAFRTMPRTISPIADTKRPTASLREVDDAGAGA